VIYAGSDPVAAAGVAEGVASEAPGARIVLPDEVVRAGVDGLLDGRAARQAVLVSSAPEPGSTPELRAFEAAFRGAYGRSPGPYAALGHAAMGTVIAALEVAAGDDEAGERQRVIEAYFAAGERDTTIGRLAITPTGEVTPPRFTAYRLVGGRRVYLRP
jgi:ABC-type branched-subunit amino acid transport system substrate-binding protein